MTQSTRREKIEAMLQKDPNDTFLLYGLAIEHVRENNIEEGVRQFAALTEKAPDYVPTYFQLGQVLAQAGRPEEARPWLQKGIAVAIRTGNHHTAEEMEAFLMTL